MQNDLSNIPDDEELNAITARLRKQTVPPVPSELLESRAADSDVTPARQSVPSGRRLLTALMATAAVVLLVIWLAWTDDSTDRALPGNQRVAQQVTAVEGTTEPTESGVAIVALAQLKPYAQLDRNLDEMEQEIAELKGRVALLDLYRKTESLLAQN